MRGSRYGTALALALAALATPVWTQPQGPVASEAVHSAPVGKIDRDAVAGLDKMGAYLRKRMNYYSTVPAPATIAELADRLEEKFGIELPFIDLFYWGSHDRALATSKMPWMSGPEVDGTTCEQYAFR